MGVIFFITTVVFVVLWRRSRKSLKSEKHETERLRSLLMPEQIELNDVKKQLEAANVELQSLIAEKEKKLEDL